MERQDWKAETRDSLLDMVRRGQVSPEEAEREALRRGIGPLATKPEPYQFDPGKMAWWNLPMTLAWIAWRNSVSVREQCPEYGENKLCWVPCSWRLPVDGGTRFEQIDGFELAPLGQSTACRLSVAEKYLISTMNLPPSTRMSVFEAEKDLVAKLSAGCITAIAKDANGKVIDVPQREWPYLKLFEENERDVLKHGPLDPVAFSELKFEQSVVIKLWAEFPIEPCMIEPMLRAGEAGFVPLCCAFHWIMTEAGRIARRLDDEQAWAISVEKLMPLISTGQVQIIGRQISGGPPRVIEGYTFAGIRVGQPLNESFALIVGDDPWISCMTYLDDQHWSGDFNDQLYSRKGSAPEWTHLQVKKEDLLREFEFVAGPSLPTSAPEETTTDIPKMQTSILNAVAQLWPDGRHPPRTKDRNAAICKHLGISVSNKTIQRALTRRR